MSQEPTTAELAPATDQDYLDAADPIREAFLIAFALLGGPKALADWGQVNPPQFYDALGKFVSAPKPGAEPYADVTDIPIGPELTQEEWVVSMQKYKAEEEKKQKAKETAKEKEKQERRDGEA
jgi:hypothetical protein